MKPTKLDLYNTAIQMLGIGVNSKRTLYALYHSAIMVSKRKEGGDLKAISAIEVESEQLFPFIKQWSNGSHAANHMI